LATLEATLVSLDRSSELDYYFKKLWSSHPKKLTIQLEDAFEDTAFKPGFEIVKFETRP
jgi:hypothetical protein